MELTEGKRVPRPEDRIEWREPAQLATGARFSLADGPGKPRIGSNTDKEERMKRSRTTVITAIAALACLSLAAMAVAHTNRIDSTVTLHVKPTPNNADRFEGKVISEAGRCERNRTVKVKEVLPGPNERVGTDTTNDAGEYVVDPPGKADPGTYVAVATRKVLRKNDNHTHVCKKERSNEKTVN
jgi:hypothetical protein